MKIGYLMNTYPVTSGTFIRREIHALERLGADITRFAVRRWDQDLVDPADQAEAAKTTYLLSGRALGVLADLAREALTNPAGVVRAAATAWRLWRNAGKGAVTHVAYLAEAASLKRRAKPSGLAHIHCHFSTNAAAVAMLSHRMGGPGYSFTAHGPDEFLSSSQNSTGLKIVHARFAVAISHFARMTLMLAGGVDQGGKIHVVRCGLALNEFPVSAAPFDDKTLVCVGRLCPQKGQSLIPEAIEAAARAHPDLKIQLIGDGESRAAIEAEIKARRLADTVELLGWRSNAEVREKIASARALLLPSFAEGLPIVIMEALALGRPVISTYVAGIPELVDKTCGWLIPASDLTALGEAISAAVEAPSAQLLEMGTEGRRRVEAWHDQDANAVALLTLIEREAGK